MNDLIKSEAIERKIIPYIPGDGIGKDIMPWLRKIGDRVIDVVYRGSRCIQWELVDMQYTVTNRQQIVFPKSSLDAIRREGICLKGPLTTPVGQGIRSLNVALRLELQTFACLRYAYTLPGVAELLLARPQINIILFRENTEDTYGGYDYAAGSKEVADIIHSLSLEGFDPSSTGMGIKISSQNAAVRITRLALKEAWENNLETVTFVHKGNIMKNTEGAFLRWGMDALRTTPGLRFTSESDFHYRNKKFKVNNMMTDAFMHELLRHPDAFQVVITCNTAGDYISDMLAALMGGLGVMPGVNVGDGVALYEAVHGSAPAIAGLDKANPTALLLTLVLLFQDIGWKEAAEYLHAKILEAFKNNIFTKDMCIQEHAHIKPVGLSRFCEYLLHMMQ